MSQRDNMAWAIIKSWMIYLKVNKFHYCLKILHGAWWWVMGVMSMCMGMGIRAYGGFTQVWEAYVHGHMVALLYGVGFI